MKPLGKCQGPVLRSALWVVFVNSLWIASGCQPPPKRETSQVSSSQVVVSASMMGLAVSVLGEISKASIAWAWEDLLSKSLKGKTSGDAMKNEVSHSLLSIGSQLDQKKLEDIQIKMNSIEHTLVQDYIRKTPEASVQLASLTDKTNELLATLDYWLDLGDSSQKEVAIANAGSYTYLIGVKLFILKERFYLAKNQGEVEEEVLESLKKAMTKTASMGTRYLETVTGASTDTWIRQNRLEPNQVEIFAKEDFGMKRNLNYKSCIRNLISKENLCGPPSMIVCGNELDVSCLDKSKAQAQKLMYDAQIEHQEIQKIKSTLLAPVNPWVAEALKELKMLGKNPV